MNLLADGSFEIPGMAVTAILVVIVSFFGWVKKRLLEEKQKAEDPEDARIRELIWRRQMGESVEQQQFYDEIEVSRTTGTITLHPQAKPPATPPPMVRPSSAPPPMPASARIPELSEQELAMASAFDSSTTRQSVAKTHRGREIDKLLRSPSAAKNAILLMEILGPPMALKPANQDSL